MTLQKLITLKEAAKALKCVPGTALKYAQQVQASLQKVGNTLVFPEAEMENVRAAYSAAHQAQRRNGVPPGMRRQQIVRQQAKVAKAKETIGTSLDGLSRVEANILELEKALARELEKLNSVN